MLGAHRLHHLDGDQLVELALLVPVVAEAHLHPIRQPRRGDPLPGQCQLHLGKGEAGDPAKVAASGVEGEAAPAGADLQYLIPGLQRQFAADAFQLGGGGLRQGHIRALENSAGVHESLVQPETVEIIAQVVMSGDVTAATGAVVAAGAMQLGAQGRGEPGDPPFHGHHRRPVAKQ